MYSLQRICKISLKILTINIVAFNANALEIFYDSQIDSYLKKTAAPFIKASDMTGVKLYLVKSPEINAFATNEKDIVFYSGLVNKTTNHNQIEGVMAHELGHLIAQHHVKSRVKNSSSGIPAVAGTILGLGAVIAGAPQAGYAAIIGGSAAGASKQLAHSREHENEADSIAVKLLNSTNKSTKGLADFFAILEREERNFSRTNPEFLNTHPSTDHRKSFIQNNLVVENKQKPNGDYDLFKAKVFALTEKPEKTLNYYGIKDETAAKYLALAIANNYKGDFDMAITMLDKSKSLGLPKQWYYDMYGQFEYEFAKFEKSIASYKKSQNFGNLSWIMDFQIAESYFALKDARALNYYFKALTKFKQFNYTYKRIGDFYAQDEQMTMAHYYITQYYIKLDNKELARKHLKLAQEFYKQEKLDNIQLKDNLEEIGASIKKEPK
tara:strand:- start:3168 stop:4481 length:1314 start_codon:yes stop_codon:yes gene_type:complete